MSSPIVNETVSNRIVENKCNKFNCEERPVSALTEENKLVFEEWQMIIMEL